LAGVEAGAAEREIHWWASVVLDASSYVTDFLHPLSVDVLPLSCGFLSTLICGGAVALRKGRHGRRG
jgi:hypothetical protein